MMPSMTNFIRNDVVLVRYEFPDRSGFKRRPVVVISELSRSVDLFVVPITSRTLGLMEGERPLEYWQEAGLHSPSSFKRGISTVTNGDVQQKIGHLRSEDVAILDDCLRFWLGLS